MKKLFVAIFMVYVAWAVPLSAQDADSVLAAIDRVATAAKDISMEQTMTLIAKSGSEKTRQITVYQKGNELRLVRFLSPADVRGVGFLRLDAKKLYLYMPAFRKVRRIASSATDQNFMGSDFTYEDMSQSEYTKDYAARLLGERNGQFVLELTPRAGSDVSYRKLIMYADKESYVYRKIEYYNREETPTKFLTVDDVEKIGEYWIGKRWEMQSLKKNHTTLLEMKDITYDQGLKDTFFSQQNLKRM
jgi:outer membrane lipoprotein-sorting protein